jgi:hypothetical protein
MLWPEHRRLQEVPMDTRPASTTGPAGPDQGGSGGHMSGLIAPVPLAWAVLLLFHPAPDENDVFGSLREEAGAWVVVHLGSLLVSILLGLSAVAVALLIRSQRAAVVRP